MVPPDPTAQASSPNPAWFLLRDGHVVESLTRARPGLQTNFSPVQHLAEVTSLCMLIFVSFNLHKLFANSVCWKVVG